MIISRKSIIKLVILMLLEFKVSNFRSIRDMATLSMVGTSDESHPDNLIGDDILKGDKVLRSAALYGANASGKSNVLHALSLMGFMVMNSHSFQRGLRLPYFPFKFDKDSSDRPTTLEVAFIEKGKEYRYGFEYDGSRIITEFLYHYPKGRKATVFERHEDQFIFKTDKAEQERIKEMRRRTAASEPQGETRRTHGTGVGGEGLSGVVEVRARSRMPPWFDTWWALERGSRTHGIYLS